MNNVIRLIVLVILVTIFNTSFAIYSDVIENTAAAPSPLFSHLSGLSALDGAFNSLDYFRNSLFGTSTPRRRCPLCDSSVYGYCSDKLFHDSCCCHNPNNPYDRLPYQCQFADCSFLHANSCQEHKLITACCCTNLLYYKK